MPNQNDRTTPPMPSTHEVFGATPIYQPSAGITEHNNGVPELSSYDIHQAIQDVPHRAGQDEALSEEEVS
jgi:hypothetical protein